MYSDRLGRNQVIHAINFEVNTDLAFREFSIAECCSSFDGARNPDIEVLTFS